MKMLTPPTEPPVVIVSTPVGRSSTRMAAHRLSDLSPLWETEIPGGDTLALSANANDLCAVTSEWSAHSGISLTLTRYREGRPESVQLPFPAETRRTAHALILAEGQSVVAGWLYSGATRIALFSEYGLLLNSVEFEGARPLALSQSSSGTIYAALQCNPSLDHIHVLELDSKALSRYSSSVALSGKRQVVRTRGILLAEDGTIFSVGSE